MKRQNPFFPVLSDSFFRENFLNDSDWASSPAVNIAENKDGFRIEVAAPGLDKEDFNISVDKRVLVISSEKETTTESKDEKEEKYYRKEFNYSSFKRSFSLPEYADTDRIKATHANGVLNVSIPKREEAKEKPSRVIAIE
ncbi:MAG: Hsp20/alpha crystallin family protein [Bacteroidales bacterium]|nr:Hsp20/alpha crystallin family protein [Bacteroidales bacterium]